LRSNCPAFGKGLQLRCTGCSIAARVAAFASQLHGNNDFVKQAVAKQKQLPASFLRSNCYLPCLVQRSCNPCDWCLRQQKAVACSARQKRQEAKRLQLRCTKKEAKKKQKKSKKVLFKNMSFLYFYITLLFLFLFYKHLEK
jgi:hypothetical protein